MYEHLSPVLIIPVFFLEWSVVAFHTFFYFSPNADRLQLDEDYVKGCTRPIEKGYMGPGEKYWNLLFWQNGRTNFFHK